MVHKYAGGQRPLFGMCGCGPSKSRIVDWLSSQRPPGDWFESAMKQVGVTVPCRLMLLEDAGGDAAAVAEHDAPVFGPDPDVGAVCPAG